MRRAKQAAFWTLVVAALAMLAGYVSVTRGDRRADEVGRMLARARRGAPRTWRRPILRGRAMEGDATKCIAPLVGRLSTAEGEAWRAAGRLDDDVARPPAPVADLLRRRVGDLHAILECSQRTLSWARSDVLVECIPAGKLLLVDQHLAEPSACLRRAADVIRLAQDCSAGSVQAQLHVAATLFPLAVGVANECAERATAPEVGAAARELDTLVAHPSPIGLAIERGMLEVGTFALDEYRRPRWALSSNGLENLMTRSAGLETAAAIAHTARRFRSIDATHYPQAIALADRVERRLEGVAPRHIRGSFGTTPHFAIAADANEQALVRALVMSLEARAAASGAALPEAPPAATRRASLRDPWSGRPLRSSFRVPRSSSLAGRRGDTTCSRPMPQSARCTSTRSPSVRPSSASWSMRSS